MFAGFWNRRAAYRQRYGMLAYRRLLRFLVPALAVGMAALYFPALVGGQRLLPPVVAYSFAAYLLVTTQLIELRGREVFWNIELRAFVYSVFPDRGQVLTSGIFCWLRHPIYSAMMRFTIALALARNNSSALVCAGLTAVGLWGLASVEERDLQGNDAGYAKYCGRVPAFFVPRPMSFWRFLLAGGPDE
jgi:protein-S-isoprenylcysteine O-methyltransferase Ste14